MACTDPKCRGIMTHDDTDGGMQKVCRFGHGCRDKEKGRKDWHPRRPKGETNTTSAGPERERRRKRRESSGKDRFGEGEDGILEGEEGVSADSGGLEGKQRTGKVAAEVRGDVEEAADAQYVPKGWTRLSGWQ